MELLDLLLVSVPLRGSGYESWEAYEAIFNFLVPLVSVPLRGSGYERGLFEFQERRLELLFPSPCGEVVMKALHRSSQPSPTRPGFRPLAGKWL